MTDSPSGRFFDILKLSQGGEIWYNSLGNKIKERAKNVSYLTLTDVSKQYIIDTLAQAGFEYNAASNKFW